MGRTFIYLFGVGGLLLLLTLPFDHGLDHRAWPFLGVALVAFAAATVFLIGFDRLPMWVYQSVPFIGSTLAAAVVYFAGTTEIGAYAMYFFWVALAGAYFFSFGLMVASLCWATALYAAVLAVRPGPALATLQWVMAVGALFVVGFLIGRLREHSQKVEQRSDRLRSGFLSAVSHELRTPLTAISGYLTILLEEQPERLSEQQRRFLQVVDRNSRRLMRLVGDILFVAQLDAGNLSLEETDFDLAAVVGESAETYRSRAEGVGIEFQVEISHVGPFRGDPGRIGQALDSLISNAIKFTPEGGTILVRIQRGRIGKAIIEVIDSGPGIDPSEQDSVFKRFYRSRDAQAAQIEGSGLGLFIARTIIVGHRGQLSLESSPGEGSTFKIILPSHAARAPGEQIAERGEGPSDRGGLTSPPTAVAS
ncbi:MAG: hypothetical protein QOJ38_2040 [Solirubrobacterales bacterium]|nr:hypothetical protein [Solirubrobacterales bacterium]